MAQNDVLSLIKQRPQELMVATGIIVILGVMVMPIPTFLLDVLISFSITFALIILMVAVFMLSPLEFSVFPSLLLVITLLRLSLNMAFAEYCFYSNHFIERRSGGQCRRRGYRIFR